MANTDNKVYLGMKYPMQKGNIGYFDSSTEKLEQAKYNLLNLLSTSKGERLMQPEFGTNLIKLVFEPNDDNLIVQVEDEIIDAVELWLPYVIINAIEIDRSSEKIDNYQVDITIEFSLTNDPTVLETFTFSIFNN